MTNLTTNLTYPLASDPEVRAMAEQGMRHILAQWDKLTSVAPEKQEKTWAKPRGGKRKMSAAGRARISAAQSKRWAKHRAQKNGGK